MRHLIFTLLLVLPFTAQSQFQYITNDYVELGAFVGTNNYQLIERELMSGKSSRGYGGLENQGLFMRYGKGLASFAHLNLGISYSKREEILVENVVIVDNQIKIDNAEKLDLKSITVELGPRFRMIGNEILELSLGLGGIGRLTKNSNYSPKAGYYARALVGLNLTRRLQMNGSYAFETTAGRDRYQSFPVSFAIQYKVY
ncbi:hypothetical protein [Portibacter lacus]|nr:hypothetical protein [Portibacter lacus]